MKKELVFLDMGRTFYKYSLLFQEKIVEEKIKNFLSKDFLLFTEHEPVITLGKRGGKEFVLREKPFLKKNNVSIIETSRGGLATCHLPGQAVFYPILNLRGLNIGVREYSSKLMDTIEDFLKKYKVKSFRTENYPGVFVNNKKIASIGLSIKKNICFHGLSININNDNSLFDCIVACGLKNVVMTRLCDETDMEINMDKVKTDFLDSFVKVFEFEIFH
ncbi:MAG: lipoyl(octanoyl) transferase LipB [Desulforegulaceae bacterium]|nr:lipoyl(octanoyl) transferase LipB [Desulforegulaceae bacterium]